MSADDEIQDPGAADDPAVAESRALSASWTDDDVYIALSPSPLTPADWEPQLPIEGTVLNRVLAPAGRQWWFVLLDSPLLQRLPADADPGRYPAQYRTLHDGLECFWAYALLIATADPDDPMLLGATDHLVDVAVVVDVSVREDPELDTSKVDPAGQGLVEIGLSERAAAAGGGRPESTDPERPSSGPGEPAPRHVGAGSATPALRGALPEAAGGPAAPPIRTPVWVLSEIHRFGQLLSPLVGDVAISEIPLPTPLASGQAPSQAVPQFVIDGTTYSYYSPHPRDGYAWRTTTDPQELLYWCVDDIARFLAWRWAQRAPSYSSMSEAMAQRTLWAPYWHVLMTAVDPIWGARTGRAVRSFL